MHDFLKIKTYCWFKDSFLIFFSTQWHFKVQYRYLFRNGELKFKKISSLLRANMEVAASLYKDLSPIVRADYLRKHYCSSVSNNIRSISPFSFISCYSQILFHFFIYNIADADSWKHFHKIRGYAPIKSSESLCSNNSLKETNHVQLWSSFHRG